MNIIRYCFCAVAAYVYALLFDTVRPLRKRQYYLVRAYYYREAAKLHRQVISGSTKFVK